MRVKVRQRINGRHDQRRVAARKDGPQRRINRAQIRQVAHALAFFSMNARIGRFVVDRALARMARRILRQSRNLHLLCRHVRENLHQPHTILRERQNKRLMRESHSSHQWQKVKPVRHLHRCFQLVGQPECRQASRGCKHGQTIGLHAPEIVVVGKVQQADFRKANVPLALSARPGLLCSFTDQMTELQPRFADLLR